MSRFISSATAGLLTVALGVALLSSARAQSAETGALNDNDGIFVDNKTFKIVRSNGAKGDPAATLAKLGAKEVSATAVIYRHGGKLYIVDGTPPANATPQFMITLEQWCATCPAYTPGSYMK
jgi:hypothetical protein